MSFGDTHPSPIAFLIWKRWHRRESQSAWSFSGLGTVLRSLLTPFMLSLPRTQGSPQAEFAGLSWGGQCFPPRRTCLRVLLQYCGRKAAAFVGRRVLSPQSVNTAYTCMEPLHPSMRAGMYHATCACICCHCDSRASRAIFAYTPRRPQRSRRAAARARC